MCVCVCVRARACVCIFSIVMLEPLLMSTLWVFSFPHSDNIFHVDAHYVCYTILTQHSEPQGRLYKFPLLLLLLKN